MLLADNVRDAAAGVLGRTDYEAAFATLEAQAGPGKLERYADVRYAGQSYELTIPWSKRLPQTFAAAYEKMYGYAIPGRSIEVVTVRLRSIVKVKPPKLRHPGRQLAQPSARPVWVDGKFQSIPTWQRNQIPAEPTPGPALVLDYGSTTFIPPGWGFCTDSAGGLLIAADR